MKLKLIIFSTLLLAGIFTASPMFSQMDGKKHKEEHKNCVMDELSPEQKTKVESIKAESDKKTVQLRADLKIKQAELNKLMIAENPSKKEINSKIDETSVIKANIQKEHVNKQLLVREQLTPEQRVKFDQMSAKHVNAQGCNHEKGDAQMHKGCEKAGQSHAGCKDGKMNK